MRVVIVGLGKTGTTALLYGIADAMPVGTGSSLEPHEYVALRASDVAAKVLLHPQFPLADAFYRQFDHIVLLVRDPRDRLISRTLYRVFGGDLWRNDVKLGRFLDLLRAKELDPGSVPVVEINRLYDELDGGAPWNDEVVVNQLRMALAFHDSFPDALTFRYEDLVENRFRTLGDLLSLPPEAIRPRVPDELARVARSRRAGNWRNWLCPEDVAHYRPLVSPYMSRYGYDDDWRLHERPEIRSEECTGYVARLVDERRRGS